MIFTQSDYEPGDDPPGVPLIGYDNQATGFTASSEADGYPASNLLNPATHLLWKASSSAAQTLLIATSGASKNYLAIARHNLLSAGSKIALATSSSATTMSLLMHFEGSDGSAQFLDSSGNDNGIGIGAGSPQIDTAQFKFGASSLLLDGSSWIKTAWQAIGTGDFTVEFWLRFSSVSNEQHIFDTRPTSVSGNGLMIYKSDSPNHKLTYFANGANRITGTTTLAIDTWYHVAVTRSGTSTKLFLNGTQEGSTYTASDDFSTTGIFALGASSDGQARVSGWADEFRMLIGSAAWTANFTAPAAAYDDGPASLVGGYEALLNCEGTDGSTTITDDGGSDHTFTAFNGAQIDTAQFKFGSSSLLLDGTNDYVQGDGSEDFAFSGDFTIELWARFNSVSGTQTIYDGRPTVNGAYITIYKESGNTLRLLVGGSDVISGATTVTTGTWYHIALTKSGSSTRLFLDGVQQGSTYSDSNSYLAGTQRPLLGISGLDSSSQPFNGWLDQLLIIKGSARYTAAFVPGSYPVNALTPGRGFIIDTDKPIIFRFSDTTDDLALQIAAGSEAAQIAVIYAGELLVMERGVKWDAQHRDLPHARRSTIVSGMSESGNFLGRVMLSEWREGKAEFAWFTPDWYRENFEPFVAAALTEPFFWAWNPDEYPDETAFAWLIEDIAPETDPATRRMAATLSMRAIA